MSGVERCLEPVLFIAFKAQRNFIGVAECGMMQVKSRYLLRSHLDDETVSVRGRDSPCHYHAATYRTDDESFYLILGHSVDVHLDAGTRTFGRVRFNLVNGHAAYHVCLYRCE